MAKTPNIQDEEESRQIYANEEAENERLRQITGINRAEEEAMGRNAEIANLEEQYAAPSATRDEKSVSPEAIKEAESNALNDTPGQIGSGYQNEDGDKPERAKVPNYFSRLSGRQKGIGGVLIGLFLAAIFGLMSITSGPLQFIHASKLLQQFHFGEQENFFEDRMGKTYRYFKWQNKPQNRRLTVVGNRLADVIEAKYQAAGIEPDFHPASGRLRALDIDIARARAKGINIEALRTEFGGTVTGGQMRIEIEGNLTTALREKRLFRNLRKGLGLSGLRVANQGRLFAKRVGITLHPIRKLDQNIINSVVESRAAWRERKTTVVEDPNNITVSATPNPDDGDPDTPRQPSPGEEAAIEINGVTPDPDLPPAEKVASVKSQLLGRAGVASLVFGLICLVRGLANDAGLISYNNILIPSMRLGGYIMALGAQTAAGEDIDAVQLGFEAEKFVSKASEDRTGHATSFFDDESINRELGKTGGVAAPDSATINGSGNMLTKMASNVTAVTDWALGPACGALNSTVGQVVSFGLDFIAGPVSAVVGFFAGVLGSQYLDDLARLIAGEELDPELLAGASLGAVSNQGAFFNSNVQFLTMAAAPLTETERTALKEQVNNTRLAFADETSWAERYFEPTNPNSVVGKAVDSYRDFPKLASIFSLPKTTFAQFMGAITPVAKATSNFDYGVPKFAYRPSEISLMSSDESYGNPYENAATITAQIPDLHREYSEECFGLRFSMNSTGEETSFEMTGVPNMKDYPDDCDRTDAEFTRYRLYIGDLMTQTTMDCYEGNEESCQMLGFDNPAAAAAMGSSSVEESDEASTWGLLKQIFGSAGI